MKRPETADHDLEELRRTLQNQRAAKEAALKNVRRSTKQAVRCLNTPTTYLDPAKLREMLVEDDEEDIDEETSQD